MAFGLWHTSSSDTLLIGGLRGGSSGGDEGSSRFTSSSAELSVSAVRCDTQSRSAPSEGSSGTELSTQLLWWVPATSSTCPPAAEADVSTHAVGHHAL
jgi:hypothetical protein